MSGALKIGLIVLAVIVAAWLVLVLFNLVLDHSTVGMSLL